jgi:hypothetical protein
MGDTKSDNELNEKNLLMQLSRAMINKPRKNNTNKSKEKNKEREVLPITAFWTKRWCRQFSDKWNMNFEVVTGRNFKLEITQETQSCITDFEFMRQMQAVVRSLTKPSPEVVILGSAGGANVVGCLFDAAPSKVYCVDWVKSSELDVTCQNIKKYIGEFSGPKEAYHGLTVEDNRKHTTRDAYLCDEKLWENKVSVHRTVSWRFIHDYAARQKKSGQNKNLDVIHVEFPWCQTYTKKLTKMKRNDDSENFPVFPSGDYKKMLEEPDFFCDNVTSHQATPETILQFIDETVLHPLRQQALKCDLLVLKVRIGPDVLQHIAKTNSLLMQHYKLVRALQIIPHAKDASIVHTNGESVLLDERVRKKIIKETGVSGGPKGVGHFLFFKRKTENQDSKQFQYEYITSTRPAWYGTLLRHPDRDLQAVFVDSRTFVRPLSKAVQRDPREPTVILQGAYNKLTKTEKDMYHQVGPVKRRVEVDIEDFLGFISVFKTYLKSYEMNAGKMSKPTNNRMKKMIMDFDYNYIRDEIPPQYYTDRNDPNKSYGQKLTWDHTQYYQEAHRLARLIQHKNNWDVPYPDEENDPFLKELSDLDNSLSKGQESGSKDHASDPLHKMKSLLFELTTLGAHWGKHKNKVKARGRHAMDGGGGARKGDSEGKRCTKAQKLAKAGDPNHFPEGSDGRDPNEYSDQRGGNNQGPNPETMGRQQLRNYKAQERSYGADGKADGGAAYDVVSSRSRGKKGQSNEDFSRENDEKYGGTDASRQSFWDRYG